MTSNEQLLSRQDIKTAARKARREIGQIENNCWYVNKELRDKLVYSTPTELVNDRPYEYIETYRCQVSARTTPGDFGSEHTSSNDVQTKHFITAIDAELVADDVRSASIGYVYIDAALDQFCDENYLNDTVPVSLGKRRSLNEVYIMSPSDNRRAVYRATVNLDKKLSID